MPGLTIESRRSVMMGLLPPKIQCSAFATAARAARERRLENMVELIVRTGGQLVTKERLGWVF